jgi:hypothetical protein
MSRIVSYLSKPNHEVRDAGGRFEGTFRWHWLASLWATIHPDREMHLVQPRAQQRLVEEPARATVPAPAVINAPALEQAAGAEVRSAPARRPRRRPAVQRAA